jgi:dihydrolipoamide dehydrogenase
MANELRADAVVIGAGPGGYPCGIRLGQLGISTIVVEKENPGGVCLNVGCIPSKALIHAAKSYEKASSKMDVLGIKVSGEVTVDMKAMQAWKSGVVKKLTGGVKHLLKANGAELIMGAARLDGSTPEGHRVLVSSADGDKIIIAKSVVLATGSRNFVIPGFEIDNENVIDSTGALALDHVPERLTVIGGGYIGLELGMVYAKLGSRVSVVEALDSILAASDPECVKVVARKLKKMGVEVLTGARAKAWERKDGRAVVVVDKGGQEVRLDADKILVSVGRRPNSENLGLEKAGVKVDDRGFVVADQQLRTNVPGIYALGDLIGGMLLAHKATKEAEVCAEVIAGHKAAFDARTIPAVVFTDPEVASTGMTEAEAKEAGHKVVIGKFPFAALGRALSVNDTDGFCKLVADADSEEVLGAHIVGNGAADLISEIALAIEMGAVLRDVALTIHPHPTMSEALMESAAAALGEAVHVVNR